MAKPIWVPTPKIIPKSTIKVVGNPFFLTGKKHWGLWNTAVFFLSSIEKMEIVPRNFYKAMGKAKKFG